MKERYSTYKSSGVEWIGEIPKHWELVKLGHHISILSGFPFKSELFDPVEGFPILRIRDITSGKCETFYKGEYTQEQIVSNNDLLVGMDGDFTVRWWEGGEVLLNQRCCCIYTNSTLSKRFLYYTLPDKLKMVNDLTYYTTVKHLSNDDISGVKITLPPLSEQEQIVKYLDEKTSQIDGLISITEKKIELLKQKRTSLINEVVTKGLNPDVELKDSGVEWIGEIPKHWEIRKGKYLLNIMTSNYPTEYIENENGVWFLKVDDLNNSNSRHELSKCNLKINKVDFEPLNGVTVVFPKRGMTIFTNKVVVIQNECYLDPNLMGIKVNQNINVFFLIFCLKTRTLGDICDTSTIPQLNNKHIYPLEFPYPPLPEQEQIVDYIDTHTTEIDKLVSIEQRRIETLKEYRQSLISEVVTGKVRVCEEVTQLQES